MWQSPSGTQRFLHKAKQQVSQQDVNESLNRAIDELGREVKRLADEVRRVRRDIQVSRRRSF
jgi:molecular chaperone GrpE (heat shock protein)